ncbi:hypothetical protein ACTXT7_009486 [Hymenolepis weldensis]
MTSKTRRQRPTLETQNISKPSSSIFNLLFTPAVIFSSNSHVPQQPTQVLSLVPTNLLHTQPSLYVFLCHSSISVGPGIITLLHL